MDIREEYVTDVGDPRVADYVSIRERDLIGRDNKFVVEGKVTLDIMIKRSRFPLESVFVSERRLPALADSFADLDANTPVYIADQAVLDEIAGFPMHRGVLAIGRRNCSADADKLLKDLGAEKNKLTLVVAIGISNHDNVGAIFRNAAAFGADAVLLDETSCDPLYRKSIRVSSGTALWLPFAHGLSGEGLVGVLETHRFDAWSLTPNAEAEALWDKPCPEKLALLLGAEGPGLPREILEKTQAVRIPMRLDVDSVNVATAGAITLSHIFMVR